MNDKLQPIYRRVLLKMSGKALMGKKDGDISVSPSVLDRLAYEVKEIKALGVELAIVIGGGNFFRGAALSKAGINRITGDYMGMLATLMNALALRNSFERSGLPVRILSAIPISGVVDPFNRRKAIRELEQGRIIIFAAGTGNPLVTTDSAASLRGIEIEADVVIKATDVAGVYSGDPDKNVNAKLYTHLTYEEALEKKLAVMDLAAFSQCRDHNMPLRVINFNQPGTLLRAMTSFTEGTLVSGAKYVRSNFKTC